jgi:hypothetical protein
MIPANETGQILILLAAVRRIKPGPFVCPVVAARAGAAVSPYSGRSELWPSSS